MKSGKLRAEFAESLDPRRVRYVLYLEYKTEQYWNYASLAIDGRKYYGSNRQRIADFMQESYEYLYQRLKEHYEKTEVKSLCS